MFKRREEEEHSIGVCKSRKCVHVSVCLFVVRVWVCETVTYIVEERDCVREESVRTYV